MRPARRFRMAVAFAAALLTALGEGASPLLDQPAPGSFTE
jgi:hypothetical protein